MKCYEVISVLEIAITVDISRIVYSNKKMQCRKGELKNY